MARFDVYRNEGPLAATMPYLLDVQCNLLDGLDTRVVVPLRSLGRPAAAKAPEMLMPVLELEGQSCLLETTKLASVPRGILRHRVANLAADQGRITGALDFLFQGY